MIDDSYLIDIGRLYFDAEVEWTKGIELNPNYESL